MQKYQDIIFVSTGMADETDALKQALSLARNNQANLTALIIHPKFPSHLADYEKKHEQVLMDELRATVQKVGTQIGVDTNAMPLAIEAESKNKPAVSIIKHVLKGSVDLVIKQAEQKDSGKGFKALDIDLLRQCPCDVWLCRPIDKHRDKINVAVAIDPTSETPEGHDLSLRLLKLSRNLADTCSADLHIISCWEYEFEEAMRHNPWMKVPETEIIKALNTELDFHRAGLDNLINESGIEGKKQVHHIRGRTDKAIPQHVLDKGIDILVMGTVARTGVAGFIIGNTAENILQNLTCSLLALKPNGFASPVKAY
jgi:nucleotide-binding universal stress UspA family protein